VGDVFAPQQPPSDRQAFRSAGAIVAWWAWLVFAVASLVALAVDGRDRSSVVTAVLLVAVTGVMYAGAWWPRIVADENGICVVNPLRSHTVPWAAVTKVDLVNAIRVHTAPAPGAARGKVVYSWAVQSSARARLRSESRARRSPHSRSPHSRSPHSRSPHSEAARPAAVPAAYGKLPPQAQEALERSPAEFVAQQLAERAARERAARERAARERAALNPVEGGPASPAETSLVRVSWAWAPIAAMVPPVLALIIVVLT
jgi:Bacterial PH domain